MTFKEDKTGRLRARILYYYFKHMDESLMGRVNVSKQDISKLLDLAPRLCDESSAELLSTIYNLPEDMILEQEGDMFTICIEPTDIDEINMDDIEMETWGGVSQ